MQVRKLNGAKVDEDMMNRRKSDAQIDGLDCTLMQEAIEALKETHQKWNQIKKQGKELREKELLDYYPNELKEEDEKNPKKKEKTLSGIKKVMMRNHTFQCLSRHVGKGQRDSVERLHKVNEK